MSKITDLPILAENDITITDMIPILDVDANTTKKVPVQTLRGLTLNENPVADITSLCTSPHTVYLATAKLISPNTAIIYAAINGGTSGIGYDPTTPLITFPTDLFSAVFLLDDLKVRSEQSPTAAYAMSVNHCFTPYLTGIYTTLPASTNIKQLHGLPDWAVTDNKFKALILYMLAAVKPGAVLPYTTA